MARGILAGLLVGLLAVGLGTSTWAQTGEKTEEAKIFTGPLKVAFGALELVLGDGASAEVQYQPDGRRLAVKTMQGEARIVTSGRNLVMVENLGGRIEIRLPSGRIVNVEPTRTEIVGKSLSDDPGQIVIRLAGLGPLAQAGGVPAGLTTSGVISVLEGPATSPLDTILPLDQSSTSGGPVRTTSEPVSKSAP